MTEKQRVGPWEKPAEVSYKLVDQPCPPCREPVIVKCRGLHETTLRDCSDSSAYSCGRACGRNLACGNHTCEKQCHEAELECAECQSACQKPRPQACLHPCKRGACHPGNCPPCNEFLRIKCHCQLVTLHPRCSDWCSSTQDREMLQSCKDRCPKLVSFMPENSLLAQKKNFFFIFLDAVRSSMLTELSFWSLHFSRRVQSTCHVTLSLQTCEEDFGLPRCATQRSHVTLRG